MNNLLLLVGLSGCASYGAQDEASGAFDTAESDATTGTTDESDSGVTDADTAVPPDPAWFAVDATLSVAGGTAVSAPATTFVTVVGADLETVLCEIELDTTGLTPGPAAVGGVWLWWTLEVQPLDRSCADLPTTVALGLGALLPDVRAQLGAVGLDGASGALYGAYLTADDAAAVSFGVGGTTDAYAGVGEASEPVPDGLYTLRTLFLVPLGSEKSAP